MTSIIIPTHNQFALLQRCVKSIIKKCSDGLSEIIVVDNGSALPVGKWVEDLGFNNIRVLRNEENEGFTKACNQGAKEAVGDFIMLLNDDCMFIHDALAVLLERLQFDTLVGAVGPVSNNVSGYQNIRLNPYDSGAKPIMTTRLVNHCMLTRAKTWRDLGGLDEQFDGAYDDDDWCLRLAKAGYYNLICRDAFVFHKGGVTYKALCADYEKIMMENKARLVAKWGLAYLMEKGYQA